MNFKLLSLKLGKSEHWGKPSWLWLEELLKKYAFHIHVFTFVFLEAVAVLSLPLLLSPHKPCQAETWMFPSEQKVKRQGRSTKWWKENDPSSSLALFNHHKDAKRGTNPVYFPFGNHSWLALQRPNLCLCHPKRYLLWNIISRDERSFLCKLQLTLSLQTGLNWFWPVYWHSDCAAWTKLHLPLISA